MSNEVEWELFRDPEADGRQPEAGHGPKLLVIGGAKGGTGKSLLAANLAIYLASLGRRVVAVDADRIGANLHGFLGVPHPAGCAPYVPPMPSFHADDDEDLPRDAQEGGLFAGEAEASARRGTREHTLGSSRGTGDAVGGEVGVGIRPSVLAALRGRSASDTLRPPAEGEPGVVDTSVRGLRLLHAGLDEPSRGESHRRRRRDLAKRLKGFDADWVVIDLGAGLDHSLLDLWLDADVHLFVTLPEPTAVEGTYRFVRATFARRMSRIFAETNAEPPPSLSNLEEGGRSLPPLDLLRRLEKESPDDPRVAQLAEAMAAHVTYFVVNQTRLRVDLELGERMRSTARRRLGVRMEYLGYVDFDDTVWNCLRAGRPLLIESPGTKASRSIEKIARRLLSIVSGKYRRASMPNVPLATHHDLLEVDRGATDEEVRRASKRARDIYAPASLACVGLFDAAGLERLRARLDEAHDVLLDPARRRPYELSVFPPEVPAQTAKEEEASEMPRPPPPVITPETVFTGPLLRAVRQSKGVRLKEVSQRTKIGTAFLRAIEAEEPSQLPALVYVRGFVSEFAKFLGLDAEHVSRTYVRRLERMGIEDARH